MSDSEYVTQREFARLEATVNETHKDVKLLLAAHNREEGAWTSQAIAASGNRDRGARRLSFASLVVAVPAALYYVGDAFARLLNSSPHH